MNNIYFKVIKIDKNKRFKKNMIKIIKMSRENQFYLINNYLNYEEAELIYKDIIELPSQFFFKSIFPGKKDERIDIREFLGFQNTNSYNNYKLYNKKSYEDHKFSYCFSRTFDNHSETCNCAHCALHKYFRSENMLKTFSEIIGKKVIDLNETFISKYSKDDFLSIHSDKGKGDYAFTYQLTKDWNPSHGGILHFVENNEIYKSITPTFNTLFIFKIKDVPITDHFVSQISVDNKIRIAYTGWFIVDETQNIIKNKDV